MNYTGGTVANWYRLDTDSNTRPEIRYGAAGGLLTDTNNNIFYISHGFSDIRHSNTFIFNLDEPNKGWKEVYEGTTAYSPNRPHPRCLVGTTTYNNGFVMFGGCLSGGLAGGPCPAPDVYVI